MMHENPAEQDMIDLACEILKSCDDPATMAYTNRAFNLILKTKMPYKAPTKSPRSLKNKSANLAATLQGKFPICPKCKT